MCFGKLINPQRLYYLENDEVVRRYVAANHIFLPVPILHSQAVLFRLYFEQAGPLDWLFLF